MILVKINNEIQKNPEMFLLSNQEKEKHMLMVKDIL